MSNIIKEIYDCLRNSNIDVYFPDQHIGECKKEYVVVKYEGVVSLATVSSERPLYTIMCYVPLNRYSDLESLMSRTKDSLRSLYPKIQYAGNETPSYLDEKLKAHMISFDYMGIRRIKYR